MRSLCVLVVLGFAWAGQRAWASDSANAQKAKVQEANVPEAKPPVPPHIPTAPTPVAQEVAAPSPSKPASDHPPPAPATQASADPATQPLAGQPPPSAGAPAADSPKEPSPRAPAPPPRSRKTSKAVRKDPSPRSLTLEALRDEIVNSPAEIEKNNLLKEREHLGELVGALDTAQKQLRRDTERLAAYLQEVKQQAQSDEVALAAKDNAAPFGAPQGPTPLETLSKTMRGMKPAQAAAIAERVPLSLAADVLQKMPARDAGRVMGLMNADRAAALAAEIASRDGAKKRAPQ